MDLAALLKNKVIKPVTEIRDDFEQQRLLVLRDIEQAKCISLNPAWRYIIGFNALAGISRLVLLLQGFKATGLYGTSVSLNLMFHFAKTKLNLPPKNTIIKMKNRRNELMYRSDVLIENEEIDELVMMIERVYLNLIQAPWRNHPYSFHRTPLKIILQRCQPPDI